MNHVVIAAPVVEALRDLHKPFRIYDECDHAHTEDEFEADQVVLIDTGYACEDAYLYSICRECCLEGGDWQTETCAGSHGHGRDKPICRTIAILDGTS